MFNSLPIPVSDIIQYLNYGFLGIILLCAIIGFFRGTLKSTFYAIATFLIYLIGIILMGPLTKTLLYMDISFIGQDYEGVQIQSIMQLVSQIIIDKNPSYAALFQEGSYTLSLIEGVAGLVCNIVFLVIIVVLSFTVYYFITFIIWLIARKGLRKLFCKPKGFKKNGKPKYKKGILSRLGGLGIGATKGLLYTLLIGFILAGAASIGKSVQEIASNEQEVAVVCIDDTFTIVELNDANEEQPGGQDAPQGGNEYNEIFELLAGYRKTIPGKVFGAVKFGEYGTTFDEYIFDSVFSIKGENGSIRLRSELHKLATILNNDAIKEIMSGGFDVKQLYKLSEEDLKLLVDTLADLDIVKVVVPVGLELITYSDMLSGMFPSDPDSEEPSEQFKEFQETMIEKLPELIKIDYCQEVKSLGYVFVDVIDLLGEDIADLKQLDFFNFDQETLDDIFESLGNMKLLEVVAPITINYLINSEAITKAIEATGFTVEDLGLNQDIDYVAELMNLPRIYEKVIDLGIKRIDGKISFSEIDVEKVEPFVETLFTSVIIKNAVPVVASTLTKTYLPDDYKGILPEEELKTVNWEKEFTPVLASVALLMKTGILNSENPMNTLLEMDDNEFNELGKYLSKSELLCNNMNELLDILLKSLDFQEVSFEGLDPEKGEYWNEAEIVSLFSTIKKIVSSFNRTLTDMEIEELAISISSSKYIKKNLNNLVNSLTRDIGFELASLSEEEWTVNEIYAVFKSINIISELSEGSGVSIEGFLSLSDDKLSIVLESKLIKRSLKKIIVDKAQPGGELQLLKGVYEDGTNELGEVLYSWDDVIVDVSSEISGSTINVTPISGISRYIVYKNGRFFKTFTTGNSISLNTEDYTYTSSDEFTVKGIKEEGELRNVFNAISALDISDISSFDIDLRKIINSKDTLFKSYILTETVVCEIKNYDKDLSSNGVLVIPVEYKDGGDGDWHGTDGELNNIMTSLDALLEIGVSAEPIYITQLTDRINNVYIENINKNINTILVSEIITCTIIDEIKKLNGNGIYIPDKYLTSNDPWLNTYGSNGSLTKEGEIARFMSGVYTALDLNENTRTPVSAVNANEISLNHMVNDHIIDDVLYSDILALTIKEKVISYSVGSNPTIYLPLNYDQVGSKNYINWYNSYNDKGVVVKHGELNHFFEGLYYVISGESTLEDIEELSFDGIFDTKKNSQNVVPQDEVLKSVIISETILKKIVFENSATISIPANVGLDNDNDRSKWLNQYDENDKLLKRNELSNLINSLGTMITAEQMTHLEDLNVYQLIDKVLELFKDDKNKTIIMKSYVVCETLKNKVSTVKSFKDESTNTDYVKAAFSKNGMNSNYSNDWYGFDSNGNPLQKELWNLLTGASVLLGNRSLLELEEISIEVLIENPDLIPEYDDNCNIISNEIEVMLKSIVLEEIFANVSINLCTGSGYLAMVMDVPSDVNWYKRDVLSGEEYDLQTFLQSFFIIQDIFDYSNNKDILSTASMITNLNQEEIKELATAVVISRLFRNNIERMFNTILGAHYVLKYYNNPSIAPWDSVKFVQADYIGNTKTQARDKFIVSYNKICTELKK